MIPPKVNNQSHSGKLDQSIHAVGNDFWGEILQFSNGKIFYTKLAHRSTVHECYIHLIKPSVVFSCQMSHLSTGKGISPTGRNCNGEQRQGQAKNPILLPKQQCAMLPFL